MRILLVEDEQEYREFISPMLFEEGYDVQTAVNGADGLRLFQSQNQKKEPFDLIVSDSIMLVNIKQSRSCWINIVNQ